jgi:D-tyrosyl-tRNA(Tyr) deacylase
MKMRAVVQRVSEASVSLETDMIGRIGRGLLVLLGVAKTDSEKDVDYLCGKVAHLRIFEDPDGRLNRSLLEAGGEMLVVSQFTLLGDCRRGRRPSFTAAAEPEHAARLYEHFVRQTARLGVPVQTGRFQARMAVSLVNDGPVTLIIDSPQESTVSCEAANSQFIISDVRRK